MPDDEQVESVDELEPDDQDPEQDGDDTLLAPDGKPL